jgi:hypothetical protein
MSGGDFLGGREEMYGWMGEGDRRGKRVLWMENPRLGIVIIVD